MRIRALARKHLRTDARTHGQTYTLLESHYLNTYKWLRSALRVLCAIDFQYDMAHTCYSLTGAP